MATTSTTRPVPGTVVPGIIALGIIVLGVIIPVCLSLGGCGVLGAPSSDPSTALPPELRVGCIG